jgi:ABC-type antimicrobial peptide transport system permease subunit
MASRRHALGLEPTVRATVSSINPTQPVAETATLEQLEARETAPRRCTMALVGAFARLGLVLALVGRYGLMSLTAAQRTREPGIRFALGARYGTALCTLLGEGLVLAAAGIALGLAHPLAVPRVLGAMLVQIGTTDPLTILATPLLLVSGALSRSGCRRGGRRRRTG